MAFIAITALTGTVSTPYVSRNTIFNTSDYHNNAMINTLNLARYADRDMLLVPKESGSWVAFEGGGTRLIETNRFRVGRLIDSF